MPTRSIRTADITVLLSVSTSYNGAKTDPSEFEAWWNGDNDVELQSLVYNDEPKQLFRNKISGRKASEMTFERERVVVEADVNLATR